MDQPRPPSQEAARSDVAADAPEIEQTEYTTSSSTGPVAPGGEVAVIVNGQPVFVDDILESLPPEGVEQLAAIRRKTTPEEFEKVRRKAALASMRPVIERTVLVQALHEADKPEKIKALMAVLDTHFEKYLQQMMAQMQVTSKGELQVRLQSQGTTLSALREAFRNDQMARYYLGQNAPEPKKPDRPQLVAYYEEHLADYSYEGQVRWQQIVLNPQRHGGPEKTRALARDLSEQLKRGGDFEALAREYSSGATASDGGTWNWTRQGSLASKEVEAQLFSLPVGGVSQPIVRGESLEIVRVLERKDAGRKSFESVQKEIEEKIVQEARQAVIHDAIQKLVDQAEVEVLIQQ